MTRLVPLFLAFSLFIVSPAASQTWPAGLTVVPVDYATVGSTTYRSSTRLTVRWTPPAEAVHAYLLTLREGVTGAEGSASFTGTSVTFGGLKSGTPYTVSIRACFDAGCERSLEGDASASAQTPEEYWQVQGTGNSHTGTTRIVRDGNTYAFVLKYGEWAGPALNGKVQLYYNPSTATEKGIKVAQMTRGVADSVSSLSSFDPVSGFGLVSACEIRPGSPPCPGESQAAGITTTQPIPLDPSLGGGIRLFFEAQGTDGRSRVMYLDSRDGYVGRDFNATDRTICSTLADYTTGGCIPNVAIGVSRDTRDANPGLSHARQFKIGYPTRTDWRWSGAPGTFMVITADFEQPCSSPSFFNIAYAAWDGARWVVQTDASGCPKYMAQTQAPMPVHFEGARYKMYFSHNALDRNGRADPLSDVKPLKVIYADGAASGDATQVDFEDWEQVAQARNVNFLWPDGSALNVAHESQLDDYVMFMPTGDPRLQIMYSNMATPGTGLVPFIGMAVLINP